MLMITIKRAIPLDDIYALQKWRWGPGFVSMC